jgi:hypothetical protein
MRSFLPPTLLFGNEQSLCKNVLSKIVLLRALRFENDSIFSFPLAAATSRTGRQLNLVLYISFSFQYLLMEKSVLCDNASTSRGWYRGIA